MTRVILVRHGQTAWNRSERFRGREDLPLDAVGRRQAAAAGRYIGARWSPAAIYCSPLKRAVETAQAIADACHLPVQSHADLIDIDYGRWQGFTASEASALYPDQYRCWIETPQGAEIPEGERLPGVQDRTSRALLEIVGAQRDSTTVIVGHTVVNRVLLCTVLGLDLSRFWHLRQETAAINVFDWDGSDFTLVSLNDTCHLHRGSSADR
jgi:broad specificity phosphatase PhoE